MWLPCCPPPGAGLGLPLPPDPWRGGRDLHHPPPASTLWLNSCPLPGGGAVSLAPWWTKSEVQSWLHCRTGERKEFLFSVLVMKKVLGFVGIKKMLLITSWWLLIIWVIYNNNGWLSRICLLVKNTITGSTILVMIRNEEIKWALLNLVKKKTRTNCFCVCVYTGIECAF